MGKFSVFRDKLKDAVSRIRGGRKDGAEEEKIEAPPIRLSDEAMAFIRTFTAEHPERRAASEDSKNAARRIFSLFREYAGDDAVITTCRIAPFRHKSMVIAAAIFSAIIFLLIIAGLPLVAIAVSVFYLSQLRNELTKKPNRLRKFFMTSEAYNVHAVAEPEGECRNTVILTAHHDSAEIRKKESGVKGFASSLVPLVVSSSALSAISLISLIIETHCCITTRKRDQKAVRCHLQGLYSHPSMGRSAGQPEALAGSAAIPICYPRSPMY